jgi:hypothetical protein
MYLYLSETLNHLCVCYHLIVGIELNMSLRAPGNCSVKEFNTESFFKRMHQRCVYQVAAKRRPLTIINALQSKPC